MFCHLTEYDALARIISEQPDRKETHSKLQTLGEEIKGLEKTKQDLEMKSLKRHKQFKVLLSAAYQLQQIIKSKLILSNFSLKYFEFYCLF